MDKKLIQVLDKIKEEGNYKEWIHQPSGYKCEVKRIIFTDYKGKSNGGGYLCGYVTIPKSHPDYGKDYEESDIDIEVHGGLTYGREGKYGFDCAHLGDMRPFSEEEYQFDYIAAEYRDVEYVTNEVNSMAYQFYKREK
jgi:hypothetical protein